MTGWPSVIRQGFFERLGAPRLWGIVAFQVSRAALAIAVAAAPALLLLVLAWGLGPAAAEAFVDPEHVRDLFTRLITAVAAASTIVVSVATFTFRRELRGVAALREHYRDNLGFRARVREAVTKGNLPVGLGLFLGVLLEGVRDGAGAVRSTATAEDLRLTVEGTSLGEYLSGVGSEAHRVRGKVEENPRDVSHLSGLVLDFEQPLTSYLARRFSRGGRVSPATREALESLHERLEDLGVGSEYAKTLELEWGLSRMSTVIALSIFPSLAAASFMALGYGGWVPAGAGVPAALALVALALAVTLFPLAAFVSHVLRFIFVNQHSLPTAGFVVGPEEPAAVRAGARRARGRAGG